VFDDMPSAGVKGRDGNERRRWEALEVHHNMVQAITEKSGKKRKARNQFADVSQLPRITQVTDLRPSPNLLPFHELLNESPTSPPLSPFPCSPPRPDSALL